MPEMFLRETESAGLFYRQWGWYSLICWNLIRSNNHLMYISHSHGVTLLGQMFTSHHFTTLSTQWISLWGFRPKCFGDFDFSNIFSHDILSCSYLLCERTETLLNTTFDQIKPAFNNVIVALQALLGFAGSVIRQTCGPGQQLPWDHALTSAQRHPAQYQGRGPWLEKAQTCYTLLIKHHFRLNSCFLCLKSNLTWNGHSLTWQFV